MAFKPSSAPHSTGASGTSSLHSVGDPDYDHFLEKTKLSHSSNEVLTTRSPGGLHISPPPPPPTSARRDRGNPISTSSSKSKGQASTSATSTPSRDSEVLKYVIDNAPSTALSFLLRFSSRERSRPSSLIFLSSYVLSPSLSTAPGTASSCPSWCRSGSGWRPSSSCSPPSTAPSKSDGAPCR